jgi:hypothetical protein
MLKATMNRSNGIWLNNNRIRKKIKKIGGAKREGLS